MQLINLSVEKLEQNSLTKAIIFAAISHTFNLRMTRYLHFKRNFASMRQVLQQKQIKTVLQFYILTN